MSGRMYFLRSFRVTEGRQLRHARRANAGSAFALLGRVEHHAAGPRREDGFRLTSFNCLEATH